MKNAEIAQLVEHNLAKVGVASPSLVFRSAREIVKKLAISFFVFSPFCRIFAAELKDREIWHSRYIIHSSIAGTTNCR